MVRNNGIASAMRLLGITAHRTAAAAALAVVLAVPSTSMAQGAGIFGSYVQTQVNAASAVYYGAQEWGTDITNFDGVNLGTVNWVTDSLKLTGWQVQTFKFGGGDVTGANMFYRVYQQGSTPPSFTQSTGGFLANSPFTAPQGSTASGGGDQNWGLNNIDINLLSGITGDTSRLFNVEVYFNATTSVGTQFSNNGGSNYIASVTVTPEPEAYAIGATGILGLVVSAWRKRKRA